VKCLLPVPNGHQEKSWCLPESASAAVYSAGGTSFHIPVTANYHWCTALPYRTTTSFQWNAGMVVDNTQMGVISAFRWAQYVHWVSCANIPFAEIQELYL